MTAKPLTARIEVFRTGTFTPLQGGDLTFSAADLRAMADAYNADTAPAPIVVGHPDVDAPAFGWVESFDFDANADRLFANVHEIEPSFAELVKAGRFKKVSMAFFAPTQGHNPVPGTWYPKHVGFLGAAAPAVSGLKNAQFAGKADVVFTANFGERGFEETASLFRMLREFLLMNFDKKEVDEALPAYRLEWLDSMEIEKREDHPRFSASDPIPEKPKSPTKEPAVTKQPDPAFAEREAQLSEREKSLAAREKTIAHDKNAAFSEELVSAGKLLPASKDKVVALLDALPTDATVSFSEGGEKLSTADALRAVLQAQPKVVSFGALDNPDGLGGTRAAAFAADGHTVDPAQLETHTKALAYQRSHPDTAYLDAVRAVS
ncbi:hypothetical protein AQS8620_01428 [Aquimixticola soesokkakensis]|uniref:Mu-like prophage I protein n=1 Tax=Aquimixticola soesokkakensis TaxID=1519096 RepID=A0A1Y5SDI9_9RHOB|nr:hypothetical protein [Aquimixticola soesokkakensis]SLN38140.1 hypothetical protein AQS8620_01428 [Aquimixticola soesokkakensis]